MNRRVMSPLVLALRDEARSRIALVRENTDVPNPPVTALDFYAFATASLNRLAGHSEELTEIVAGPFNAATVDPGGKVAAILSATGRLEQVLRDCLADFHEMRGLVASDHLHETTLLVRTHRHVLDEFCGYLQRVVDTLGDPRAALSGVDSAASADLELSFDFEPTPPPTLAELSRISRARYTRPWRPIEPAASDFDFVAPAAAGSGRGPGFWRILGTVALGAVGLDILFGGDCDG